MTLNKAIRPLRRITQYNNIYLADTDVATLILKFDYDWNQIHRCFHIEMFIQEHYGLFIFPTFTGRLNSGHWHVTIITNQPDKEKGFIIDSLGHGISRT